MRTGAAITAAPRSSALRSVWMFFRHFLEMCIPMCLVGTPVVMLAFVQGPGILGYADPRTQYLYLSVVAISLIYTAPMFLWMRFRGMAARPTWEMSAATVGLGVVLVALTAVGALSESALRGLASAAFCGPACVLMVAVMFTRLGYYTGQSGHAMHPHVA